MYRIADRLYIQSEVNRIFSHVNNRTLLVWAERGLVETAAENIDGRGRNRLYSKANLLQLALIERMAALNLNFETIKQIMEHFAFGLSENGKAKVLELLENEENLIICWTLIGGKKRQPIGFTTSKEGSQKWTPFRLAYEMEIILRLPVIAQRLEGLIKDAGLSG